MRRFMIAVVVAGAVIAAGVSFAQGSGQAAMPEKVFKFLDGLAGTWNVDGTFRGHVEYKWDSRKKCMIGIGQWTSVKEGVFNSWTDMLCWDGKSEDGISNFWLSATDYTFARGEVRGKVLSEKLMEGKEIVVGDPDVSSTNLRIEHVSPDKFIMSATNVVHEGEKRPDMTIIYTRAKSTSDEQELIRLQHEWCRAEVERDDDALGHLLADDYALVTPQGTVITRAQMLSKDEFNVTSMTTEELKVRIYENMAIVKGLARWSEASGKSTEVHFTDTWLKRDGQWQCVATHESGAIEIQEPSPEMKKLEGLVGTWTYEGEQVDPLVDGLPYGPAGKFSGTFTNRFVLGGFFLERKLEENNPAGRMTAIEIIGYDPKENVYTQNLYLSEGNISVSTATLDGRIWTSNSTMTTKTGEKVLVKGVVKYAPDWNSFTASVELSPDNGKTWKFWFKDEGRKVNK